VCPEWIVLGGRRTLTIVPSDCYSNSCFQEIYFSRQATRNGLKKKREESPKKAQKAQKRKQGRTAVSFEPLKRLKLYLAFAIEEGATR
jgi:hypothetical protein